VKTDCQLAPLESGAPSILLRVYEIEGSQVETPVESLGRSCDFGQVNLLEEDLDQTPERVLRSGPYAIKTVKLNFTP
jgi:hypothetical protein